MSESKPHSRVAEALDITADWLHQPLASDPYGTGLVAEVLRELVEQLEQLQQAFDSAHEIANREAGERLRLEEQCEATRVALLEIEKLLPVDDDPYDGTANGLIRKQVNRGLDKED